VCSRAYHKRRLLRGLDLYDAVMAWAPRHDIKGTFRRMSSIASQYVWQDRAMRAAAREREKAKRMAA
jgi:hypothetical protein